MFSLVKGTCGFEFPAAATPGAGSELGEGDELPNCFLERSRLGRPLPCAIRLRTQRSNHVAALDVKHGVAVRSV